MRRVKFVFCTKYELHPARFPGMHGRAGKFGPSAGPVCLFGVAGSARLPGGPPGISEPPAGRGSPSLQIFNKKGRGGLDKLNLVRHDSPDESSGLTYPTHDRPELGFGLGTIRGRGGGPDCPDWP